MIKSINIFIQNTNQKHTPNVSQGGSGQVTGVMKLPGVEHLKTVPYYGDVHGLTLTLRSTAQGVNLPRNPIPLLTHHAIPLFIHTTQSLFSSTYMGQCFTSKSPLGACGLPT